MSGGMGGFGAFDVTLRSMNLLLGSPHSCRGTRPLGSEFRNFQDGKSLSIGNVIADIHVHLADITRNLGVNIYILERLKGPGDGQNIFDIAAMDARHSRYDHSRNVRIRIASLRS